MSIGDGFPAEKVAPLAGAERADVTQAPMLPVVVAERLGGFRSQRAEASIVLAVDHGGADIAEAIRERLQCVRPVRRLGGGLIDGLDRANKKL